MTHLDFGAGWKARHTLTLRSHGLDVTAHDYGRNFDPHLHDSAALQRQYDVVFASNVLNTHVTENALWRTTAQICLATKPGGLALVNYPLSPRKLSHIQNQDLVGHLFHFFDHVARVTSTAAWRLTHPRHEHARRMLQNTRDYTAEEIAASNLRPSGAVGPFAIVPRLVLAHHTLSLEQQ